jgi:hydrogenase nickel incorporation protein HypB
MTATRSIQVYRHLKGANAEWAEKTRALLRKTETVMVNMIGSPGCGKTSLLECVAARAPGAARFAVLEGDVETTRDAERLAAANVRASQLLTGGACHLEARMVHRALEDISLDELDLVFVENVGNLVCPAEFDIGESAKVAFLSVTEGEDKPLKYPLLFREARAALLTKIDLLPHLDFDVDACLGFMRQVHPDLPVIKASSRTGEGLDEWMSWLGGLGV